MARTFDLLVQGRLEEGVIDWCCSLNAHPEREPHLCEHAPVMTDTIGYRWCQAHRYRGDMLDVAKERGWPEVRFRLDGQERYAVIGFVGMALLFCLLDEVQPGGAFFWSITALYQPEEYVLELFAALASPVEKAS